MRASHRSEKASRNIFQLLQSARWAVLLPQCGLSIRGYRYHQSCNPSEWRLFIGSSSRSLKAVLLHNGNNYPTLPMANSVHLKEDCTSVKMLLSALKYVDYGWEVIGYFKMVSFLMGLQGSFTKFPCFLCLKDSITKTGWGDYIWGLLQENDLQYTHKSRKQNHF